MDSATLTLIFDDIQLGIGLARLANISFRLGELSMGREWLSDSEACHSRAERLAANLSCLDDKRTVGLDLNNLRLTIRQTYSNSRMSDLHTTNPLGLTAA